MSALPRALPHFLAAGEALTDLLTAGAGAWHSQPGGSTWNVARAMARLGVASAFAGAVSSDVFGDELVAASAAAGLDSRFLQQVPRAPLLAIVHALHPPRYFFIGENSADLHFNAGQLPEGWQGAAQWVHFGGISLAREPLAGKLRSLAERLKAQGVRISYDPNFRSLMDQRYDATLRHMAGLADVIKVSEEDLCGLFRHADAGQAFQQLREMNPGAAYLYTLGERGARLHTPEGYWEAAAPSITVADTVGAGDASIAGLLFSLIQRPAGDGGAHLRFAVGAGAAACLAPGATPPALATVDQLAATVACVQRLRT